MASPVLIAAACLATNLSCATAPPGEGLPRGKAEPPRTAAATACSRQGDGFVWSPETDTCIKMGGYMRVDGAYMSGR